MTIKTITVTDIVHIKVGSSLIAWAVIELRLNDNSIISTTTAHFSIIAANNLVVEENIISITFFHRHCIPVLVNCISPCIHRLAFNGQCLKMNVIFSVFSRDVQLHITINLNLLKDDIHIV